MFFVRQYKGLVFDVEKISGKLKYENLGKIFNYLHIKCIVDGKINYPLTNHVTDFLLYLHKADFIQGLLKKNEKKLAQSFNFTFRYIDDVHSLNNSKFGDFVHRIYPIELQVKDTTDTARSASYLDLHLEIDSDG